MMKKIVFAALFIFVSLPLFAASSADALRTYITKALAKCPDSKITIAPIERVGPIGFVAYAVTQTSSDTSCGRQTFLLHSPTTNQVVLGTVFALPMDDRSVEVRAAETAGAILKQSVTASISGFPQPDGLRALSLTKLTPYGPFSYHGFIDASQRFMIIGTRGSLFVDPGTTLTESLGIENAVHRGNAKSPVKIIELSDFECPTCAKAHKKVEPLIATHLSKIEYLRLDLPIFEHHEWALPAALGARAIQKVAPAKYWSFVNFVFANQETIGKMPSFDKVLQNFCEDHDIDWKRVEKIYRAPAERSSLLDQVSRAFDSGVTSTPTYIINGQIMGFGPDGSFTIAAIKQALGVK